MRRRVSVEEVAALVIGRELACAVEIHDDGSSPSMYDLRIGPLDEPLVAIECVGAVDPVRTETWNVGFASGEPLRLNVRGDWGVSVRPDIRLKTIRAHVEAVVSQMEELGIENMHADYYLTRDTPDLAEICDGAGILGVTRVREVGSGEAYLWMEGIGGAVNTSGTGVAEWVEEFLSAPEQVDVLEKLRRSGAPEREVFIAMSFGGAPWSVESYLSSDTTDLPPMDPVLPSPVTGIWVIGMSKRVRFTRAGWKFVVSDDD